MTTVITNNGHSRFGGSVATRVINCPGSVALCSRVPKAKAGVQALIGTAAHALAETCLKQSQDAHEFRGEFFPADAPSAERFIVEDDMIAAVQVYLNTVRAELALSPDAELYVETAFELDLPGSDPGEVFGRNDAMVYHPSLRRLRVFDYKHGKGISVSADDNDQLKFYAVGATFNKPWALKDVICTVVQPRALDVDEAGAVKDWPMDPLDLFEFKGEYGDAVKRAKDAEMGILSGDHDPRTHLNPYPGTGAEWRDHPALDEGWCRFCDARPTCPAKERQALDRAKLEFSDVTVITVADLPEPKDMHVEKLAAVVGALDLLTSWANRCQEQLEALVLSGVQVPGWKAVEKIGRAKWVDEPAKVANHAGMLFDIDLDQIMPRKLATITETEKLLKAAGATKDQIDDFKLKFTIKESSGLTIARASDKRPAVDAIATDFGSVNTSGFIE